MVLKQVAEKNVGVKEDSRHLASHSLDHILGYRLLGCPPQFLRRKHRPVMLERTRRPLNYTLGALETHVPVLQDERDGIASLQAEFPTNLGGHRNLPFARDFRSQLSHRTTPGLTHYHRVVYTTQRCN